MVHHLKLLVTMQKTPYNKNPAFPAMIPLLILFTFPIIKNQINIFLFKSNMTG